MARGFARDSCPFCGGKASERREGAPKSRSEPYYWIECCGCGARGPRSHVQHEIDRLWNARSLRLDGAGLAVDEARNG